MVANYCIVLFWFIYKFSDVISKMRDLSGHAFTLVC